ESDEACCRRWPYVEDVQIESDAGILAGSDEELGMPVMAANPHLMTRRGGVSAEPAGANNV
ncbi:pkaR, partial [Symbiodinium pilosum]